MRCRKPTPATTMIATGVFLFVLVMTGLTIRYNRSVATTRAVYTAIHHTLVTFNRCAPRLNIQSGPGLVNYWIANPNYPHPSLLAMPLSDVRGYSAERWMMDTVLFYVNQNPRVIPVKLSDMSVVPFAASAISLSVSVEYPQAFWGIGREQVFDVVALTRYRSAGPKTLLLCYEQAIP